MSTATSTNERAHGTQSSPAPAPAALASAAGCAGPVPAVAGAKRSRVEELRVAAAEASRVRSLSTHPDVVALRVESVRTQVDRCMWAGILLGLAFTMVNVQDFAAQDAAVWSLPWLAAWLLDPMVSVVLIAVLRAEQITARYQVSDHTRWIGRTKRFAFAATYAMNTWSSFRDADLAGIVLHSVPPLLVFCAAETAPVLRDRLTEAVLRAEHAAAATQTTVTITPASTASTVAEPGSVATGEDSGTESAPPEADRRSTARDSRTQPARADTARAAGSARSAGSHRERDNKAGKRGPRGQGGQRGQGGKQDKAWAHWQAERVAGRMPSGAELARVAGADGSMGRRWRRQWEDAEQTADTADTAEMAAGTTTSEPRETSTTDTTDTTEERAA